MGARPQPCINNCPFKGEQRGELGCRPTERQVDALGGEAMRAYALCMTTRMDQRDVDSLTGLLGYDRFLAEAGRHIDVTRLMYGKRKLTGISEHARSALVGFIDGDGLKAVNDGHHGHHGGDRVIRATGQTTLRSLLGSKERADELVLGCFRESEVLAARRSGDEFVYALFGLDPKAAAAVAQRVDRRLSHISVRGLGIQVSATMSSRYLPRLTSHQQFRQAIHVVDKEVNNMKEDRRRSNRR